MNYADIVRGLEDRTLTVVSERTGISRNTLSKIARSEAVASHRSTLELLSQYLSGTPYQPTDEAAE